MAYLDENEPLGNPLESTQLQPQNIKQYNNHYNYSMFHCCFGYVV